MANVNLKIVSDVLTDENICFTNKSTCVIGRSSDCQIKIPGSKENLSVSREHCLLEINPPNILIKDLNSANGTIVNKKKIEPATKITLQHGDYFKVGNNVFFVNVSSADVIDMESQDALTKIISNSNEKPLSSEAETIVIPYKKQKSNNDKADAPFSTHHFSFNRKPFQGIGIDFLKTHPLFQISYERILQAIAGPKYLIMLVGGPGLGKSILLNSIMYDPTVALDYVFFNKVKDYDDILNDICDHMNLSLDNRFRPHQLQAITSHMKTYGDRKFVIIVDNSDQVDQKILKNIFLLCRISNNIRVLLVGENKLKEDISEIINIPLNDNGSEYCEFYNGKIASVNYHRLNASQSINFIRNQLIIAGDGNYNSFSPSAVTQIVEYTKGVPETINALCSKALFIAESSNLTEVSLEIVNQAFDNLVSNDSLIINRYFQGDNSAFYGETKKLNQNYPRKVLNFFENLFNTNQAPSA